MTHTQTVAQSIVVVKYFSSLQEVIGSYETEFTEIY